MKFRRVSEIVVIDVDVKNGGQDSLKDLAQRLGKLPHKHRWVEIEIDNKASSAKTT